MTSNMPFWIAAVFGTAIIILQLIMMMLGLSSGGSGDVYHDVDTPGGTEDAFKILSLQTIAAFFMAFGWGGLAATEQFGFSTAVGTLVALLLGVISVFIIRGIFKLAMSLNTPGVEYDLKDIVGQTAKVYERILPQGTGQIQIFIGGMLREIAAISDSETEISSGQQIVVSEVVNKSTVKVK